ncbi:DUF1214 domain-containing protein [Pseudomonas citronellolis]|uniref:DUF1214 domain-containing protein n=1 Tax=Pseudomonas citronellolis TaxID=53408 RepID=UPI0021C1A16F|nr:DUF1214 domain-containing protein [Pseudomonas citronellolis]UXJ50286.1 DUF1214 domain-containing protein [Pseudomonas citronellolis]
MTQPLLPWSEYVDLLKEAGDLLAKTWAPDAPQVQAHLWKQLAMNIAQGYFLYFQANGEHPDWSPFENSVFMLQPNPDAVYYYAPVCGNGIYRVVGERGNAPVVGFATGKNMIGMGDPPGPGFNNYDLDQLQLETDGSFEVIFSQERPAGHTGNWLYLHPEAKFILLRQFSLDWGREKDVRLAIERLDTTPLKPASTPEVIDQLLRELFGGYVKRLSNLALNAVDRVRSQGLVNKMALHDFKDLGNGDDWPQAYFECAYEIGPDEALILETELPEQRHYWNVQVIDGLWNQVELVYRQSSLNGHQARVDADGKFRAVVSTVDPGIHNWLDTGGNLFGLLIGRWYRCSSHPTPVIKKVPLSELRQHLPEATPTVDSEERAAQLRKRRIGAQLRRRW